MEVSMICSQVGMNFSCVSDSRFGCCNLGNPNFFSRGKSLNLVGSSLICSASAAGFTSNPSRMNHIVAVHKAIANPSSSSSPTSTFSKSIDRGRFYVAMPLDVVSKCNTLNHIKAITVGLKALKLTGIDGVELPIWWGVVEKEAGDYDWSSYLQLVELISKMGLKIHASIRFNASKEAKIPLPEFVSKIGESNSNIFFTDRSGHQCKDCLSLSVDDLPVLDGRSPIQAYGDFCERFKLMFASYLDSTITGVTMGLGPNGDLCYPSQHGAAGRNGVGEFQCYDKHMLLNLKHHAESTGNQLWGLGGPHDAPKYDEAPTVCNFFKDQGGSWETPYGDFFLSWYSNQLISHGNRLLSVASSVFSDTPVAILGKIPLNYNLCSTKTHPCELTSGFYNTANRNGYEAVAQMFARNSASLIVPGMDLNSSPESLIAQIKEACRNNGVNVTGQNSVISVSTEETKQIKKNLTEEDGVVNQFIYQRMGADFFSPKHFALFTKLVRGLSQPDVHFDDLPAVQSKLNLRTQAT